MLACTHPKVAIHKRNHHQSSLPRALLSYLWSSRLSSVNSAAVCWASARNSPRANKLPGCEELKLRAIGAEKLFLCPKAAVDERAKSYRRSWMQILLGGADKTLLPGFVKQRRPTARRRPTLLQEIGAFARLRQAISIGASDILVCSVSSCRTAQCNFLLVSLQQARLIENIRSIFCCACKVKFIIASGFQLKGKVERLLKRYILCTPANWQCVQHFKEIVKQAHSEYPFSLNLRLHGNV